MPLVILPPASPAPDGTEPSMALTPTARRMLDTLPSYYWSEPLIERIIQAWANEIDRIDARLDAIMNGLVASLATDELRMLALWETMVGLPVEPPDASVTQRMIKVTALLQAIGAGTAARYIATINQAVSGAAWQLLRDTPGNFQDTLELPFEPGSYNAGQLVTIARRMHPAHRQLLLRYEAGPGTLEGFLLDESPLDLGTL